jgi:hypothetical protein
VADSYKDHTLPWLEKELTRQLAPLPAPDSLWRRINQPVPDQRPATAPDWVFWPVAAAMVLLALAGLLRARGPHRDTGRITEQEMAVMAYSRGPLDLRSDDFEATRAWVKSQVDIDVEIPAGQPAAERGAVRLLGARLIRLRGLPVAAIDYQVGDRVATLIVSGRSAGLSQDAPASRHVFSRIEPAEGMRIVSWNMRNQTYAIAYSGAPNSHAACLLCHANSEP